MADIEEQLSLIRNHHLRKTNHRGTIQNYINTCEICQRTKYSRKTPYISLVLTETPSRPFEDPDIFYYNLTIVDIFPKFAQAISISEKTAVNTYDALTKYFTGFGIPQKITLDTLIEPPRILQETHLMK